MYRALNSKQRDVMIQCLLLANHQGQEWEWNGEIYKCEPGQFITSLDSLKKVCGADVKTQSIRTALLKLEKWQFLTNQSTKTGRLITIINWDTYQGQEEKLTKNSTKSQQSTNKELTTNKNVKNEKNKTKGNGVPDFIDKELWKAFREHRQKLRKPMTDHAEKIIFGKLQKAKDKGHDPHEMVETAIERGWQSVFEPHPGSKPKQKDTYPI